MSAAPLSHRRLAGVHGCQAWVKAAVWASVKAGVGAALGLYILSSVVSSMAAGGFLAFER